MKTQSLNQQQINTLIEFTTKHQVNEINLNKAESRYFFDFIEVAQDLERSRILLQPVFAEGYMRNNNGNMVVIIIQRVQILKTDKIAWEDGYDDRSRDENENHYNPFTRKLFEIFIDKMGLELLLDKIAERLSRRYPLSKGQATAIMIKYLGFPLDSGTRSFLHDLRKKIRKYQLLIAEFQEYVLENEKPELIPLHYMNELIDNIDSGNINDVLKKVPSEWINRPIEDKLSEFKSILEERKMRSESREEMDKLEQRFPLQRQPDYKFVCQDCDHSQDFVPNHSDKTIGEAPQHHGKPMIIRIVHITGGKE